MPCLARVPRGKSAFSGLAQFGTPPVRTINKLEAGGWIVAPWDFGEREPKFVTLLNSLNR
jgi:hypothetical protein